MKHELIGANIIIIDSKNPQQKGLKGKIIDETKNTLKIRIKTKKILQQADIFGSKNITIEKKTGTFEITTKKGKIIVQGIQLAGRPEERIKKISR